MKVLDGVYLNGAKGASRGARRHLENMVKAEARLGFLEATISMRSSAARLSAAAMNAVLACIPACAKNPLQTQSVQSSSQQAGF